MFEHLIDQGQIIDNRKKSNNFVKVELSRKQ